MKQLYVSILCLHTIKSYKIFTYYFTLKDSKRCAIIIH